MSFPFISLEGLGNIQTGSTPATSEAIFWNGSVPFVTPAELDQQGPVLHAPRTLSIVGSGRARILQKDAVMVCCIGSLGKIGIAGRALVTNQQINSIEFDTEKILPKYGYYACRRLKPKLIAMAPATTVAIVSKSKFAQLEIPVPPLSEQRRIAEVLDRAETLRVQRRQALAQLDALAESIFLDMFGDPTTNPRKLKAAPLSKVCQPHSGATPSKADASYWEGTVPWFSPKDLKRDDLRNSIDHVSDKAVSGGRLRLLPAGTVLIVVRGMILAHSFPVGVLRVAATINQDIKALIPRMAIDADLLATCLRIQTKAILELVSEAGHGTKRLDSLAFEKIPILLPESEEQAQFAHAVEKVREMRVLAMDALLELDTLFASLQHRAFRGEL